MFAGQVRVGASRSCTVTVKLHRLVLPLASVATQVTTVWPTTKRVPDGGTQSTVVPGQLSFAGAAKVTTASHRPAWLFVTMFAGQVMVGISRSCTVTVKLQRLVLPLVSVATQFTVVTPFANVVPEDGAHVTVAPLQLSVALAAYVTTASQRPGAVLDTMFAGQLATGAWLSFTVTENEHAAMFPLASVAVHVTGFVPRGKRVPDGGAQTTAAPGQLSVILAANVTTASQRPASLLVTMFAGQVTTG